MTITRTFIPDPPASGHDPTAVRAPPSLAGANLKVDESVWAAARKSYLGGCATPVIAERHGLNERTVRRRAAQEGWAEMRRRGRATPAGLAAELLARTPPVFAGEPRSAEAELERVPDLEPFVAAHSFEVGELLLDPQPERLARFAFRRSAEAASTGAATEALAWMRLVQAVDRSRERRTRPFSAPDYVRAAYAAELRAAYKEGLGGDDAPEPGPEE